MRLLVAPYIKFLFFFEIALVYDHFLHSNDHTNSYPSPENGQKKLIGHTQFETTSEKALPRSATNRIVSLFSVVIQVTNTSKKPCPVN